MDYQQIPDGQYTKTIYTMIKESRYEDAIKALNDAINFNSNRAGLSLLGYCYYRTQSFVEAANCYEQLSAMHPDVPEYKLYFAQALYEASMFDEAYKVTMQVTSPELEKKVTKLQSAIKYGEDDTMTARTLVESYPQDDPDKDINLGCLLYKENQYEEALQKFSKSLNILGFNAHLHYNVALCYFRLKEYPQALKHITLVIEKGIRDHPELGVGMQSEASEVKSVGNTLTLHETALTEVFNLKAAIEYQLKNLEAAREALSDMPPRHEHELDAVTLHNIALTSIDIKPNDGFEKLHFLLQQDPFPHETFANLLLLYCKFEYYDLAADILAENAQFTYKYLTPYLYDFLDAIITSQTSPEEAFQKYEDIASKHAEQLRKLTKIVQESRSQGDNEQVKKAVIEYEEALERYIPVVMAQAKIYWDMENYGQVEKIFRKSVEFCNESDVWRLNVAHVLFMQENKYKEAASFYEPIVKKQYDNILDVSAVVLANLCVSYIMTSQNEEAEDIMRKIEKEEEQQIFEDPQKKFYHLCIVNLVIGTLYCAKGNYEFGISRVIKSLEPFNKRLGTDTWFYAKRCFLSFLENLAKHLIVVKDNTIKDCMQFLEGAETYGRRVSTVIETPFQEEDAHNKAKQTVTYEARLLRYMFYKLRSIDDSVTINKYEDLK
ncbi:intraflagellar transport protein 70A [Danaus plexippus]|uniref:Tetratricopeptide repeat protein 30 n=1 Tax=Danaus plexippus plexippus TaxID=278856 RepID=A0A212ENS3_DANPL|nr:intraflagellar transport protein 70A [Danaus plexippus]OWR43126.1 tetratricopeptide repeat protein 30A [Danaus plexippus plexippus]